MPINSEECVKLVCTLAEEKNLKVTVTQSLKGGLVTGAAAVGGGLLLGPIGLAVGGALGGIVAAVAARNKFQSLVTVIMGMTAEQKERMAAAINGIIAGLDYVDAVELVAIVMGNEVLQHDILYAAKAYFENEMKMELHD